MSIRRALTLSLLLAVLLSAPAFAAERAVPASPQAASPAAPASPPATGFLAEISCSPDRPAAFSPAPLPMVAPFPPARCGVCSEPECVGLTRGETCPSNPDYVCGYVGRCTEDNLSRCECGLLQPI
jgi:hypothetical protein